jgi:hypothetical protein
MTVGNCQPEHRSQINITFTNAGDLYISLQDVIWATRTTQTKSNFANSPTPSSLQIAIIIHLDAQKDSAVAARARSLGLARPPTLQIEMGC